MDFGRERENGPIRRPLGRQSLDSGFRHNEKKANERETPLVTNYSSFLDMTLEKMEHKKWNIEITGTEMGNGNII